MDHLLRRPLGRRMFGDIEIRRRSWRRTMKTNRTLKVAVGKVKKSSDTKSFWPGRKPKHKAADL